MRCTKAVIAGVVLAGAVTLSLLTGEAMAIEEPNYTVIEQAEDFELRQYEPYIVAETLVEGDFSDVGNEGFRRLAGYIFGKNRKEESIDMTAPVNQEPSSEKIAMTAPVNQQVQDEKWRITFTMPAEYTLETLPTPLDDRVTLKREPGRLIAAIRYSGTWSKDRYEEKQHRLRSLLEERGLKAVGKPVFARYNSPFSLWFLRRNEVLIPVERSRN
ncbi:MAG: heme-binding protein [Thiogranum sp.]